MTLTELATELGVSESDAVAFVSGLRIWTDRGYTVEQAIGRHMAQMTRLVNNAAALASDVDFRTAVAGAAWDAVNAA
jgi:plasmid maintenance system antidote protein VapI